MGGMGMKYKDCHLNLFYSYNQGNELIENNLTRAFIVTLKHLSQSTSQLLLKRIFGSVMSDEDFSFVQNMDYALQGNIPIQRSKIKRIPRKYLIALTGNNIIENWDKFKPEGVVESFKVCHGIPDAWIFDISKDPEFCFLIECKTIEDTLTAEQIISYAKLFYGMNDFEEIEDRLIRLTWYDVLETCESFLKEENAKNEQEEKAIKDLMRFFGYYGVKLFKGFDFSEMSELPEYDLAAYIDFRFDKIPELPDYKLGVDK
jgi:hypothetical protein